LRLDELSQGRPAYVDRIDWDQISPADGQRLREFGMCEGASVELLHRGGWGKGGAVACRIGRMTIAMRANHAAAIEVVAQSAPRPAPEGAPAITPEGALLS
jgi:ferrous iron transport protein A